MFLHLQDKKKYLPSVYLVNLNMICRYGFLVKLVFANDTHIPQKILI